MGIVVLAGAIATAGGCGGDSDDQATTGSKGSAISPTAADAPAPDRVAAVSDALEVTPGSEPSSVEELIRQLAEIEPELVVPVTTTPDLEKAKRAIKGMDDPVPVHLVVAPGTQASGILAGEVTVVALGEDGELSCGSLGADPQPC